jgi:hypothetical protein
VSSLPGRLWRAAADCAATLVGMDGDEGQGMIFNFLFALAYESNMSE